MYLDLNQFIRYSRFLHEIPDVTDFDYSGYDIDIDKTLPSMLEYIYEWEYKYGIIQTYSIPDNRKSNMLSKIEDKINPIIDIVAGALIETYSSWISNHDVSDPSSWAKNWGNNGNDLSDTEKLASMWFAYNDYCYVDENSRSNDIITAMVHTPSASYAVQQFILTEIDSINDDREFINTADQDINYLNSILNDINASVSYALNMFGNAHDVLSMLINFGMDVDDFIQSMYENIIMTKWHDHWEYEGLDETVENNKNILNELNSIGSQSFKQKFATLSLALNGLHVTGSMLDHVNDKFVEFSNEINTRQLDELSNISEKTLQYWEDELKEGL